MNGSEVPKSDKKIHDFSITKLRKRKRMTDPIETAIIRGQQNFDIYCGLNPIEIEIKNGRIINILKRYKNPTYRIVSLGLLFPASITNGTNQIFVLGKNLNGVKKTILNKKIYDIWTVIDLNKINNWKDIKGQSIWTNTWFKDNTEINNNAHLCFPFTTKSFSDLSSFSIYLQDDNNNIFNFKSGEKKVSIFNFQIDIIVV